LNEGIMSGQRITTEFLEAFADAWNQHDADAILAAMTDDCVMQLSSGPDVCGSRFVGQDGVRSGIERVFARMPDVRFNDGRHFVAGDRGLSEWILTATTPGGKIEVQGCDVFTFRDGKIAVKDSYLKQRTG
jgi:ketosteroid isomerase-like protein